eukprot:g31687.t1
MQSLPQMKTWMASTFADKANKAQSEAMWEYQIAAFMARLDAQADEDRVAEQIEAAHGKLDRDTNQLVAELCGSRSRCTGWN